MTVIDPSERFAAMNWQSLDLTQAETWPARTAAFASKGGVGKTGVVASIAVCAQEGGSRVAVLDADPRADMCAWAELRKFKPPTVIAADEASIAERLQVQRESGRYDLVLIDTAGGMNRMIDLIMRIADVCVVPTSPSFLDIRAANEFLTLASRLERHSAVLLNKCLHHPARIEDARSLYAEYGYNAAPAIRFRVDHQDAIAAGLGVTEYNPSGAAAAEIRALWGWLRALLWTDRSRHGQ